VTWFLTFYEFIITILYQKITELRGHVKLKGVLQRMEDRFEILLAIYGMSVVSKTYYLRTACLPFVIRHLIVIDELRPYLRNMQKMKPLSRTSLKQIEYGFRLPR
jgi:hypothetical protein